jgi:hypothetical protein
MKKHMDGWMEMWFCIVVEERGEGGLEDERFKLMVFTLPHVGGLGGMRELSPSLHHVIIRQPLNKIYSTAIQFNGWYTRLVIITRPKI